MNRGEILQSAYSAVTKDRQTTHGRPENNFETIAKFWSVYLDTEITSTDVGMMMVLLKVARQKNNIKYDDNYVDVAGYAACAGELAENYKG